MPRTTIACANEKALKFLQTLQKNSTKNLAARAQSHGLAGSYSAIVRAMGLVEKRDSRFYQWVGPEPTLELASQVRKLVGEYNNAQAR